METILFTIVSGQIVRMDVANNTLDLGIYERERVGHVRKTFAPRPS